MTICYFGIYNPEYSRNAILIKGLKQNKVKVLECRSDKESIKKYFDLIKKHRQIKNSYDIMMVGFPGYQAMILARFLTRKKIVFDAFTSIYDSLVCDRKVISKHNPKAFYYWCLDWLSCKLADRILLDTNAHIDYFSKTFKVKKDKFIRVFIGANDSVFNPSKYSDLQKNRDAFVFHFHGNFIPLQGIDYIVEAARIILDKKKRHNIRLNIVGGGGGRMYESVKEKIKEYNLEENIKLTGKVPIEEVAHYISLSDVCLGIFGDTDKTKRVIPNKVYEYIAMAKPVITANTLAIEEIFSNNKNILLCDTANSKNLAEKMNLIIGSKDLREKISNNSRTLYENKFIPAKIARDLLLKIKI